MLRNILFTSLPLLAEAAYLDPSLQQQKPLLDSKPASGHVIPLAVGSNPLYIAQLDLTTQQLDQSLHYTYPISSDDFSSMPLEHLQNSMATYSTGGPTQETITINIPLNTSLPGIATFYTISESESWSQAANQFTWMQQERLHLQPTLGVHLPLLGIGIRKSGMISMPAESATLDLSTPYIHVPKGIWDVLLLATSTEQQAREGEEVLYVDCGALNVFPDLVFGIERKGYAEVEEGEDDDDEELIIRPEQYILQTTEGKCMLLARNADSCHDDKGAIKLGWAAVRGRDVVLDWRGGRVGFGQ